VLIGGLGILVTGVMLGSMDDADLGPTTTTPVDGAARSVAHVSVVDGDRTSIVTGVVLDDRSHVLLPAAAIEGADEVWVRCEDGKAEATETVGRDESTGLAVVRVDHPAGLPARDLDPLPDDGTEIVAVHAKAGTGMSTRPGVVVGEKNDSTFVAFPPTSSLRAEVRAQTEIDDVADVPALDGGVVFDRGGRWVGLTVDDGTPVADDPSMVSVTVMPASEALAAASRILATS
jgi:hypothetical protein